MKDSVNFIWSRIAHYQRELKLASTACKRRQCETVINELHAIIKKINETDGGDK